METISCVLQTAIQFVTPKMSLEYLSLKRKQKGSLHHVSPNNSSNHLTC
jgi:hypothetical protein